MIELDEALKQGKYVRRSKISDELEKSICKRFGFSQDDVEYLKQNFIKIAPKRILDFNLWKEALGIMNVPKAEFLAKQIFKAIDRDKDGLAFFEDYVAFTFVLTKGNVK